MILNVGVAFCQRHFDRKAKTCIIMCINTISINIFRHFNSSFVFGWLSTKEETFLFVEPRKYVHVLKLVLHNICSCYQNRCLSHELNWFLLDNRLLSLSFMCLCVLIFSHNPFKSHIIVIQINYFPITILFLSFNLHVC